MINVNTVLESIEYIKIKGNANEAITSIECDSRKVIEGSMFFCVDGCSLDGHKFIENAIKNGARVIVVEKDVNIKEDITVIKVKNGRQALAVAASNFFNNPKENIKIIGITGTNGKTTCSFMLKSILESAGFKVGLIGTIYNEINDEKIESDRTTPDPIEFHRLLSKMVKENIEYCVMEVSSHSLCLDRVYGVEFLEGIFTNLTQDHFDFHKNFEEYYKAKLKLFKTSKCCCVNLDDSYGKRIIRDVEDKKIITYGLNENSEVTASNIIYSMKETSFTLKYKEKCVDVKIKMPGDYNVLNALGSVAAAISEGIELKYIKAGLESLNGVKGRYEFLCEDLNLGFNIVLDYAHTPDGLEKIITNVRRETKGEVITLFGCVGDGDKYKRPMMGELAVALADHVVVTSDNSKSEEPMDIIEQVVSGAKSNNFIVCEERREGIKKALLMAKKGDTVIIAGKGHENSIIAKGKKIKFNDKEVVEELIKELYF